MLLHLDICSHGDHSTKFLVVINAVPMVSDRWPYVILSAENFLVLHGKFLINCMAMSDAKGQHLFVTVLLSAIEYFEKDSVDGATNAKISKFPSR